MNHNVVKIPEYKYSFREGSGEAETAFGISDQLDLPCELEGCMLKIKGASQNDVSVFSSELVAHGIEPVAFSHP